ncbi:MAG: hypothetical protein HOM58_05850 [Rhodospirillaceae bacterium]|jgi:hypothetical protein|nr:hypothetical protein [Rhodospirillaceae bacterium]MBT5455713.1 hypothetical protein [Rhodospirillaceae bacterium]
MMKHRNIRDALSPLVLLLFLSPLATQAQEPRYSSDWGNPDEVKHRATPERPAALDALIRELRKLTRDAERHRAADPTFLADLKNLARRYSWPWKKLIVMDDFRDGDLSHNPSWKIRSGSFTVGRRGLISTAERLHPTRSDNPKPRQSDDLARQILGGLLQDFSREKSNKPVQNQPRRSRIFLNQRIPNRFAINVKLRARTSPGDRFEFGVGQGNRSVGYYLQYNPGASPALSLVQKSSRGRAVIESVSEPFSLEGGKWHTLLMTRDRTGDMTVVIDGKTRMRVRDRSFRDAFDRFVITNRGGRYAIRSVTIHGASEHRRRSGQR